MTKPYLPNASSPFGAPMGRRNVLPCNPATLPPLTLYRLEWEDGDYDKGGAYWGGGKGDFIFVAQDEGNEVALFVRATTYAKAHAEVLRIAPRAEVAYTAGPQFKENDTPEFREFVHAYLVAALWSSTDDEGEPLDARFTSDDIHPDSLAHMIEECRDFWKHATIPDYGMGDEYSDAERAGHDFWLTRNHHGAGFWDRGFGKAGDRLTEAAHTFGECYLYVGDDGMVHSD